MTPPSNLSRRAVLAGGAGAAAVVGAAAKAAATPAHEPFQHGVASGDPLPRAVVQWTRVTPTPGAT